MSDNPVVLDRRSGAVAVVRLNRPAKRNALDSATLTLLNATLDALAGDDELRVLVLSTTDPRAFCAGADVGEPLDHEAGVARMAAFTHLYAALDAFPVPVVAVCVGNCVGAGAEIAASADLRVAGDNLKLSWPGARLGVPVGPARLTPLIGLSRAKDLIYTGRVVGAQEALDIGLVHRSVPAAEAEDAALELADEIATRDGAGLRVLKSMFAHLENGPGRVAYENELLLRFQREGSGLPRRA